MNKKLILILIIILIILSLCYNNTSINYISEALTIQKVGDNYEDPNAGENFQENITWIAHFTCCGRHRHLFLVTKH